MMCLPIHLKLLIAKPTMVSARVPLCVCEITKVVKDSEGREETRAGCLYELLDFHS